MTVKDAVTPSPLTVTPRTTVATALRLIRDNQIGHLPVLEEGRILGVVSEDRILALTPSEATTLSRHEATDLLSRLTVDRAVDEAVVLDAATPLTEAARALLDRRTSAALVVERGQLGGIVTHSDLLRAFIAERRAGPALFCAG
jgi:CBS domain-containing protein